MLKKSIHILYITFFLILFVHVQTGIVQATKNGSNSIVQDQSLELLPSGVKAVWDIGKASRKKTSTRESICINGLWQWQPAQTGEAGMRTPPVANWGWFKVPGPWPGISDYMQKDDQHVYVHPNWQDIRLANTTQAWYQREIEIPEEWNNRRIVVRADYVNSRAVVFIDGKRTGEILFPSGEVDISEVCRPGSKHLLSLEVTALPLADVIAIFSDTNAPRSGEASVKRRGLCGDLFLDCHPEDACIEDVQVETSVRNNEITVRTSMKNIKSNMDYHVLLTVFDKDNTPCFTDKQGFRKENLTNETLTFKTTLTHKTSWKPKYWDIHTPENMYEIRLILVESEVKNRRLKEKTVDEFFPVRFGFREFWIEGRDLYLNGSRIWLSCVPFDNAQVGAALANYEAAKESMRRLKSFGVNFVYTHNYDCNPGSYISFAEILRAADDVGMLFSFSQPHFGHYNWDSPDAETQNGYVRLAQFLVGEAFNHPSVIFYSMSHNATGYSEDMNPHLMDGIAAPRSRWAQNNINKALRAAAIVNQLDSSRIVYHHASGNLGPMHISNFYVNWVPVQEMSDWFEHWATVGLKPMFTCEYGVPFTWDWAMYRGWYKGVREFGSAPAPWEFCNAEWNAQFVGDAAFQIGEPEKKNLRWEAQQFHDGKIWRRWDYPAPLGSRDFTDQDVVFEKYITDNWRAFRTWGLSINSFWEHGRLWRLKNDIDRSPITCATDWDNLQHPGFSPDFQDKRYERIDLAFELSDWIASSGAQALIRNNSPLLAYIGGKEGAFTSKDHNYLPGETVEKQFVIINNSRETATCRYMTRFDADRELIISDRVLETGQTAQIPFRFTLPDPLTPGKYTIHARFTFSFNNENHPANEIQEDSFTIHVMSKPAPIHTNHGTPQPGPTYTGEVTKVPAKRTTKSSRTFCRNSGEATKVPAKPIALFDPKGETGKMFDELGIEYRMIDAISGLKRGDALVVIGRNALDLTGDGLNLTSVPEGLKVIVFEQTAQTLEKRLGFRTAVYGLRQVFRRVADHPLLTGITDENLHDWRGEATLLPPKLEYETDEQAFNGVPTVQWCGITVPRVWRCGNRGNVASVLIEKPACGDFLPVLDGGFSLQYAPLMEYRQGRGMILFCQMDVTGRTENDPAAQLLVNNIIQYVNDWKPEPRIQVTCIGNETTRNLLSQIGVSLTETSQPNNTLLVLSTGSVAQHHHNAKTAIKKAKKVLAVGLEQDELKTVFPAIDITNGEHISTYFEPFDRKSPLCGIGPADLHNRDPKVFPLVTNVLVGNGYGYSNGIVAITDNGHAVICGLAPWQFPADQQSFKRTFRRTAFTLSRLLSNLNADIRTPLVNRFHGAVGNNEQRWLDGLYLDQPEEWDDPYRFFRW